MDRVHYLLDDQRRQLAHFFLQVDSVILAFQIRSFPIAESSCRD